jgi:hypothetical protein
VGSAGDDLWARCEEALRDLTIPSPFDSGAFLDALAAKRGRRIELVPAPLAKDTPCGVLISTDDADYIYYAADTTPLHAEHILLHEVGHLVLDHRADVFDEAVAGALLPNLSPNLIRRMLCRTIYSSDNERQAELFASIVLQRAGRSVPRAEVAPDIADGLARIASAFDTSPRRGKKRG